MHCKDLKRDKLSEYQAALLTIFLAFYAWQVPHDVEQI